ncbi:ABC-ATPase domain-containing protein [Virgibacillus halophilus]|uniref:ABC-ATPase domain-containing protein n=1 Tax=Tigheibacillus halophilus TaxID=361280 RepID=A0ABU5C9D3_9BACI|nr:ABC-ATPase domain-containing protein [Virgibacillus halophilus]
MRRLLQLCRQLDKKGYGAYKSISGTYQADSYTLSIDYVQGDPFAAPSKIRLVIPAEKRLLHPEWLKTSVEQLAVEDVLARSVAKAVNRMHFDIKGSGKSGEIFFDGPGQEIIKRTAIQADKEAITVCMAVGLPANGRRINGNEAHRLFADAIPKILKNSIFTIADEAIENAVRLARQQAAIRKQMWENGWIAFIANGAILPRKSGIDDRPLQTALPFQSTTNQEVSIEIPYQKDALKGMAIKKGITLIVGGGYHGKSTLLSAIEKGVYNHTAGDGREFVLTDMDAVKIRAEDGRQITNVNISPFIRNLPMNQDTEHFSTENASGSTSQAANVIEALEAGATTLLLDEDTCATNFMIRDMRMQQLVSPEQEPITPFIDNVTCLRDKLGVSAILVMGGSGDYFDAADDVIQMNNFLPEDVTEAAKKIAAEHPVERLQRKGAQLSVKSDRVFRQQSFKVLRGKRAKVQAKGLHTILMGQTNISFPEVEQIADMSQTRMIAQILLRLASEKMDDKKTLVELLDDLEMRMSDEGLASFTAHTKQHPGDLAQPRRYEIAAVLNRMRTAVVDRQAVKGR